MMRITLALKFTFWFNSRAGHKKRQFSSAPQIISYIIPKYIFFFKCEMYGRKIQARPLKEKERKQTEINDIVGDY